MAGWLGRTVVGCVVVAAAGGIERPAQACSPPPELDFYPQLVDRALVGVPTDGVIAFRASTLGPFDDAMALLSIEVLTQADEPVAGTIETIEIGEGTDFGVESHQIFVVWRPDAAFAASTEYVATINVQSTFDPKEVYQTTLQISTGAGASGPLALPDLGGAELVAMPLPTGPRVCCDEDLGACFAECAALEVADQATLSVELSTGDDPMFTQSYIRSLAGTDGALEDVAVLDVASRIGDVTLQRSFPEPGQEYCIAVEVVSLIDGGVSEPMTACMVHGDLVLGGGPNPDFDAFVEGCEMPYWEDTGEPYVPGDDTTGGDDGTDGGTDGGSADGTDTDGDSAEGGDATAEGTGAEDGSGGSGGDQSGDGGGCACALGDDAPAAGPLGLLVVLGIVRRRRR